MRVLSAATLVGFVFGRIDEHELRPYPHDDHELRPLFMQSVDEFGGDCDCSWISIPGACNPPGDGSPCWTECCGGGPTPTPPPPTPTPPPAPGCKCDWKDQPGACQFYGAHFDDSACWKQCCGGDGPSPGPTPAPGKGQPCNLVNESGNQDVGNGFSRQGGMRYHSQEKLDLLGGGLSFTVDLSKVNDMVNANLYLVIPGTLMGGSHFYCDNSSTFVDRGNACIELDIFESNGHQLSASTMHTKVGTNSGCDTWGCRQMTYFGSTIDGNRPFDINVRVSNDGDLTVQFSQNGKSTMAFQNVGGFDGAAKAAIVDGMRNHGAIVMSSMWTGWVPPNNAGTGDLDGSHYTLSNLQYEGRSKGRV